MAVLSYSPGVVGWSAKRPDRPLRTVYRAAATSRLELPNARQADSRNRRLARAPRGSTVVRLLVALTLGSGRLRRYRAHKGGRHRRGFHAWAWAAATTDPADPARIIGGKSRGFSYDDGPPRGRFHGRGGLPVSARRQMPVDCLPRATQSCTSRRRCSNPESRCRVTRRCNPAPPARSGPIRPPGLARQSKARVGGTGTLSERAMIRGWSIRRGFQATTKEPCPRRVRRDQGESRRRVIPLRPSARRAKGPGPLGSPMLLSDTSGSVRDLGAGPLGFRPAQPRPISVKHHPSRSSVPPIESRPIGVKGLPRAPSGRRPRTHPAPSPCDRRVWPGAGSGSDGPC